MQTALSVLANKKAVIFDLDDTLGDPRGNHLQGLWNICKNLKKPDLYMKMLNALGHYKEPKKEMRRVAYQACDIFLSEDVERVEKLYWEGVGSVFHWVPYAKDAVFYLKIQQKKKLGIVTNGGLCQHGKIKSMGNFSEIFDSVKVTGDYGEEKYKPDPFCLSMVVNELELGVDECVYIGDRIELDKKMAESIGMDFILADYTETRNEYEGVRITSPRELYEG